MNPRTLAAILPAGPLGVLAGLLLSSGCLPVPTVVGRPAAVVPRDVGSSVVECFGGALLSIQSKDIEAGDRETLTLPGVHGGAIWGLGHGTDVSFAINNEIQGAVILRQQVLGRPEGYDPPGGRRGPAVDASLEAGLGGTWLIDALLTDVHLGVNVSFPCPRVTPYVSYRHHWVSHPVWTDDNGYEIDKYRQEMIWLGFDFPRVGVVGGRAAVEVFYGWPHRPQRHEIANEYWNWGVNFILRERGMVSARRDPWTAGSW